MSTPILIALSIFAIFIIFNLYIRVKTFGMYRELVQRRIQFRFQDVFNRERWEAVLKSYPNDTDLLKRFRTHMIRTGILFVAVILAVLSLLIVLRELNTDLP